MLSFVQWVQTSGLPDRPWLVFGKGPTFAVRRDYDLSGYNLAGLNHTVREQPVDVAHAIDVEVVRTCGEALENNCRWLLMPRRPHRDFAPGAPLESYFDELPTLRRLSESGRLVWYNLNSSPPYEGAPIIRAKAFSAEAMVDLLGHFGARAIRTLGIDGGHAYSDDFGDLRGKTLLANGQKSFDAQFAEIRKLVERHGLDFAPLAEPLRVFVGMDDSQLVAARTLEFTIRKHSSRPVVVDFMQHVRPPLPRRRKNRPRTGFSFRRFAIPQLCNYRGRALYLDADMQVFGDIAELWDVPFGDAKVLCTYQPERPEAWKHQRDFKPGRQLSVMMLDCSRLHWNVAEIVRGLDDERYDYQQLMCDLCIVEPAAVADLLPPQWNCLEWYEAGRSKLVHYTVVPTQPWKNDENPLREVWTADYREAVADGAIPPEDVLRGAAAGYLKSSLLDALAAAPASGGRRYRLDWRHQWQYRLSPVAALLRTARRYGAGGLRRLRNAVGR